MMRSDVLSSELSGFESEDIVSKQIIDIISTVSGSHTWSAIRLRGQ